MSTDLAKQSDQAPAKGTPAPASKPNPLERFRWLVGEWAAPEIVEGMTGKEGDGKKVAREIRCEVRELAAELAGPSPTPMERSLAETAALCHAELRYVETSVFTAKNRSLAQATYDLKRLGHAHRRYLTALRTLATVRRLAVPALKVVNIAQNQQVATVAGKTG